jgi:hypothetical protein
MAEKGGLGAESESIADKYFVCTECLVEGNVQSFVDLFYLVRAGTAHAARTPFSAPVQRRP